MLASAGELIDFLSCKIIGCLPTCSSAYIFRGQSNMRPRDDWYLTLPTRSGLFLLDESCYDPEP